VVDLRTGGLAPHNRQQAMTKITIATPQGDCRSGGFSSPPSPAAIVTSSFISSAWPATA